MRALLLLLLLQELRTCLLLLQVVVLVNLGRGTGQRPCAAHAEAADILGGRLLGFHGACKARVPCTRPWPVCERTLCMRKLCKLLKCTQARGPSRNTAALARHGGVSASPDAAIWAAQAHASFAPADTDEEP